MSVKPGPTSGDRRSVTAVNGNPIILLTTTTPASDTKEGTIAHRRPSQLPHRIARWRRLTRTPVPQAAFCRGDLTEFHRMQVSHPIPWSRRVSSRSDMQSSGSSALCVRQFTANDVCQTAAVSFDIRPVHTTVECVFHCRSFILLHLVHTNSTTWIGVFICKNLNSEKLTGFYKSTARAFFWTSLCVA